MVRATYQAILDTYGRELVIRRSRGREAAGATKNLASFVQKSTFEASSKILCFAAFGGSLRMIYWKRYTVKCGATYRVSSRPFH